MGKKWYQSKTLWVNLVAAVCLFVENQYGYAISPELQAYALIAVNVVLRLVTKDGLAI